MPPDTSPAPIAPAAAWRAWLIAAITVAIVWWFVRALDFGLVWQSIRRARAGWLGLMLAATAVTYLLRASRWRALLQPLGPVRFGPTLRATIIGFTVSFLLPGKLGEVIKPYLLARSEGLNASAAFATVVIERIIDMLTVLLFFVVFLLHTTIDVGPAVRLGGAAAAAGALAGFAVLFAGAAEPGRLVRWTGVLARPLPARLRTLAAGFVGTFATGLAVMRRPGPLVWAAVQSIGLWLSIALGIWSTSQAFDLTFPFDATFLIMMFLVVGVAVPTPGSVGSFHAAYIYAVTVFLVPASMTNAAAAAAIVLHALSVLPVAVVGLALMAQERLTLASVKTMRPQGGLG